VFFRYWYWYWYWAWLLPPHRKFNQPAYGGSWPGTIQPSGSRATIQSALFARVAFEAPLTVVVGKIFKVLGPRYLLEGRRSVLSLPGGYGLKLLLSGFLADRSAATAVEYGLVMAGIALAILASMNGVGTSISSIFTTLSLSLK
jgi:pilus assembly protein Flp/PilA